MEGKTLGGTQGDEFPLVETLADTVAEVEKVGDTRGDAHALVNTLADMLAEVGAVGHTRSDAHAMVDTALNARRSGGTRRQTGICERTGQHYG